MIAVMCLVFVTDVLNKIIIYIISSYAELGNYIIEQVRINKS